MRQRARRNAPRPGTPLHQEPLEDRVDKAGQRLLAQRNAKRRAARAKAKGLKP